MSQTAVWDNKMVVRKREGELGLQVVLVFGEGFDFRPIRLACWRTVRLLRSTPYVLIVWLTGEACKAA